MNENTILTFQDVVDFTGARHFQGSSSAPVTGVSIDSRTINPGELFIGLRGPHFNGEDFVGEAIKKGAGAILLSDKTEAKFPDHVCVGVVEDALKALIDLARGYRLKLDIPIIAVTGSSGKTSTKDMIDTLLSKSMSVYKSPKSFNNHIGVCLSTLQIRKTHHVACLELGTNAPGEIEFLASLVRPTIAVVLNIGPAHLEGLGDLDGVFCEKMSLYRFANKGIFNKEDIKLSELCSGQDQYRSFGICEGANVRALKIALRDDCTSEFDLWIDEENLGRVKILLPGLHQLRNVLAAICVADMMKMDRRDIILACSDIQLPKMRWEQKVSDGILIINDAYNANPQSMRAALDAYKLLKIKGRKFFVCGDMMELGRGTEQYHQQLGEVIADSQIDCLITIGEYAQITAAALMKKGEGKVFSFRDKEEVVKFLMRQLKPGDSVLIKGSRVLALEEVESALLKKLAKRDSLHYCA